MIAKVNGTSITASDIEKEVTNIVAQYQGQMPPEQIESMMPNIKKQALETQINKIILVAEADAQSIQPTPEQVKEELDSVISRFPSETAFEEQLVKVGIPKTQIEDGIEQQIKINMLIGQSIAKEDITVTEDELTTFYQENPESFQAPEQVQAAHILFKFEENAPQSLKDQKRLEMAGILGRIEKGSDFGEMAKAHSDCPSKEQGGDLGLFERGKMVKPFEDAAFNLNAGELSDIVESPFGYHLIKVLDKKEPETIQLEAVKDKLTDHLRQRKEQDQFIAYVDQLRAGAEIEYAGDTE
jgi:peptidyl-prolyl cis-trans isomerase C